MDVATSNSLYSEQQLQEKCMTTRTKGDNKKNKRQQQEEFMTGRTITGRTITRITEAITGRSSL